MCSKVALICAPKAIKGVLVWLIDQPIALAVRDTLTGNTIPDVHAGKARGHDRGTDRNWLVHVTSDVCREPGVVSARVNTGIYVDAHGIGQRCFQSFERGDVGWHV